MGNLTISAALVDGSLMPYIESGESCRAAVELVTGDDMRPPVSHLTISITTASGKTVVVHVPNDPAGRARVEIDGVEV